jgi:imidazolonepropionase-like amidohydrolase
MGMKYVRAGRLVDGKGGASIADGAVLIDGDRLVEVGPAAALTCPERAERFDFPDHTLMPGLVDCHVHLNDRGDGNPIEGMTPEADDLRLLQSAANAQITLQAGITTLRECGAARRTIFSIKEALRRGIISGPRMSVAGPPITMTGGHAWAWGGEADGVDGVRHAVRQLCKQGADWIKIMATGGGTPGTLPYRASYSVQELKAAVEQAHALNRLIGAHAGSVEGIERALEAGLDMLIHCGFWDTEGRYCFRQDLAREIADRGVWVNPTLHIRRVRIWRLERISEERPLTESEAVELAMHRKLYFDRCEYFRGLMQAGVRQVAGSDSGYSYYLVGDFADEVEAMATEGMGAAAAVRSATLDAAESIGLGSEVGSLDKGKQADLLLIDGDPTVDITALKRVHAVFLGGKRVRPDSSGCGGAP